MVLRKLTAFESSTKIRLEFMEEIMKLILSRCHTRERAADFRYCVLLYFIGWI